MDVLTTRKRIDQYRIVRHMGEHAQLDLRIVSGEQEIAGAPRNEGSADFLADLGANRDVLQIRIGRREPAGRRHSLIEARVHAMGLRIDQ